MYILHMNKCRIMGSFPIRKVIQIQLGQFLSTSNKWSDGNTYIYLHILYPPNQLISFRPMLLKPHSSDLALGLDLVHLNFWHYLWEVFQFHLCVLGEIMEFMTSVNFSHKNVGTWSFRKLVFKGTRIRHT